MINRNTFSKTDYLVSTALYFAAAMFAYALIFYFPLLHFSEGESKLIFWGGTAALVALGTAITIKQRRNNTSIAVNILLPLEIYTVASCYYFMPKMFAGAILASLVLALVFMCVVIMRRENACGERVSLLKRIAHGFMGGRTIFACCMAVFFETLVIVIAIV